MNCVFCNIIEGSIPAKKVYEDDLVLAFYDIEPQAPVHVQIIPKKHITSMNDVTEADHGIIAAIHAAAREIAKKLEIDQTGYRLINNCGQDGGQVVFHLHFHLLGGKNLGPLIS